MSYPEYKKLIYLALGIGGIGLLVISWYFANINEASSDPLGYVIPSALLFFAGTASLLFCLESFYLRDDPDIWR